MMYVDLGIGQVLSLSCLASRSASDFVGYCVVACVGAGKLPVVVPVNFIFLAPGGWSENPTSP